MWRFIKIPKALALLAFFLPWMTVSCSDQKVADATGWQLISGQPHFTDSAALAGLPKSLPVGYLLGAAFALIAIGLILAFLRRPAPRVLLASTAMALLLTWGASLTYSRDAIAAGLSRRGGLGGDIAASRIHVDWQWGFWVAVIALAIAAVMAWMAMNEARAGPGG